MGTSIQTVPTVGLSVKTMKHAGVSMKAWDLGGSAQFRSEWGRYTRGCDVILFLVDTNDVRCHYSVTFVPAPSDLVAVTISACACGL
jgi:GTPase SAR1 family protein